MAELMRIQVPKGWSVMDNKFYDVDPVADEDKFITNWYEGFIEDVLWIRQHKFNSSGEFVFPDYEYFCIDLGWMPESTMDGEYQLILYWNGNDERKVMDILHSQNRFIIRDKMELWMRDIEVYYDRIQKTYRHSN